MPPIASLLLASSSPRRRQLLASVGIDATLVAAHTDEVWPELPPGPAAAAVATDKLVAARAAHGARVDASNDKVWLAADTVVVLAGKIFGKPKDEQDAVAMLRALRGQTHEVYTGFVVARGERTVQSFVLSQVTMRAYDEAEMVRYARTGEALDKSGAYAIQSGGTVLSARIDGSLSNIVGLPIAEVLAAVQRLT